MVNTTFLPLPALRTMVQGGRDAVAWLRAINARLQQQTAKFADKKQYTSDYIARETAKLREAAGQEAGRYLIAESVYQHLWEIAAQKDFWTTPAYLFRAPGTPDANLEAYSDSANTTKLLKVLISETRLGNLLFQLSRMSVESLTGVADSALALNDWSKLGAVYAEVSGRAEDADARGLVWRLQSITIPDVVEALDLIAEGKQLEEFVGLTLRSISEGIEDAGVRIESYITIQNDMDAAKKQVALENELARESYVVKQQLGENFKAA